MHVFEPQATVQAPTGVRPALSLSGLLFVTGDRRRRLELELRLSRVVTAEFTIEANGALA